LNEKDCWENEMDTNEFKKRNKFWNEIKYILQKYHIYSAKELDQILSNNLIPDLKQFGEMKCQN